MIACLMLALFRDGGAADYALRAQHDKALALFIYATRVAADARCHTYYASFCSTMAITLRHMLLATPDTASVAHAAAYLLIRRRHFATAHAAR